MGRRHGLGFGFLRLVLGLCASPSFSVGLLPLLLFFLLLLAEFPEFFFLLEFALLLLLVLLLELLSQFDDLVVVVLLEFGFPFSELGIVLVVLLLDVLLDLFFLELVGVDELFLLLDVLLVPLLVLLLALHEFVAVVPLFLQLLQAHGLPLSLHVLDSLEGAHVLVVGGFLALFFELLLDVLEDLGVDLLELEVLEVLDLLLLAVDFEGDVLAALELDDVLEQLPADLEFLLPG